VENAKGKKLMEWIEENGWEVLNGNKEGDEEREWTYIGSSGETGIDYGIVNEEAWERVEEFRRGERAESNHFETALTKRRGGKEQRRKGVGDKREVLFLFYFFEIAVLCLKKM
jgi:hypothetical protein